MKKRKAKWFVISVTSSALIIFMGYYFLGGKASLLAEHYWWQQDPEIVKVSERFKSMNNLADDKMKEAVLLFPIIKIGASSREVEALLGKPPHPMHKKREYDEMHYVFDYGGHDIYFRLHNGIVVDKGGA